MNVCVFVCADRACMDVNALASARYFPAQLRVQSHIHVREAHTTKHTHTRVRLDVLLDGVSREPECSNVSHVHICVHPNLASIAAAHVCTLHVPCGRCACAAPMRAISLPIPDLRDLPWLPVSVPPWARSKPGWPTSSRVLLNPTLAAAGHRVTVSKHINPMCVCVACHVWRAWFSQSARALFGVVLWPWSWPPRLVYCHRAAASM